MIQAIADVRIEADVLRQELLQKAVVAAANLEDQVRARNRSIGERNNVYMRRRVVL